MAPLLVTALVGVGVKVATDWLMSGAKDWFKTSGVASSFASTLDKARTPAAPSAPLASAKPLALDSMNVDRSRLLAAEMGSALPATTRAQGAESYRRLAEIPQQAI